jgi:hypothetical protein
LLPNKLICTTTKKCIFLKDQALTLEQRLAQFDLDRHGGEVMNSEQILGAERW